MQTALPRYLKLNAISVLGPRELKQFQGTDRECLSTAIDEMGQRSKRAQGLSRPITTWSQVLCSDHRLYLSVGAPEERGGLPTLRGLLRVGERSLFVRRDMNSSTSNQVGAGYTQISPTCVLDFYVHESCQRKGDGRKLFDAMLAHEGLQPHQLALDRPSPKLIAFYRKHFGLSSYTPQDNKFVVFDEYWARTAADPLRRRGGGGNGSVSAAFGRRSGAGGMARRLRDEVAAASVEPVKDPTQQPPSLWEPSQPQQQWDPLPNKQAYVLGGGRQQQSQHTLASLLPTATGEANSRASPRATPTPPPWQFEGPPQQPLSPELHHQQHQPQWQQQYQLQQHQQPPPPQWPQQQPMLSQWQQQQPPQHQQRQGGSSPWATDFMNGNKLGAFSLVAGARGHPLAPRAAASANTEALMGRKTAVGGLGGSLHGNHVFGGSCGGYEGGGGGGPSAGGGYGAGGHGFGGSEYHDQVHAQREQYRRSLEQRMHSRPF